MDNYPYQCTVDQNYPEARHVSLTLFIMGVEDGGWVNIWTWVSGTRAYFDQVLINGVYIYEFDTDNWRVEASNTGGDPVEVWYQATVTWQR